MSIFALIFSRFDWGSLGVHLGFVWVHLGFVSESLGLARFSSFVYRLAIYQSAQIFNDLIFPLQGPLGSSHSL